MSAWHNANGADNEPVGTWRRPYAYVRDGESVHDAVNREVVNTRENVGLLDASTLGKLVVSGPDAGKFLDMMYTNMMSTLPVGKCRYGLMCTENGFLMDDGVVARIDDETWLCHTTTGGAERIPIRCRSCSGAMANLATLRSGRIVLVFQGNCRMRSQCQQVRGKLSGMRCVRLVNPLA